MFPVKRSRLLLTWEEEDKDKEEEPRKRVGISLDERLASDLFSLRREMICDNYFLFFWNADYFVLMKTEALVCVKLWPLN